MAKLRIIFCLLVILYACQAANQDLIIGNWLASRLEAQDSVSKYDIKIVQLQLQPDFEYRLRHANHIVEHGNYEVDGRLLILKNDSDSIPTRLHIFKQQIDTLILRMNLNEKEAFITFIRADE